jgi:2,4-didehydro-3-deoxy-L-rhamnonate hydrolase
LIRPGRSNDATGTPVSLGMGRKPQRFLRAGDTLRQGIAGLGEQRAAVHAWDAALLDRVHGAP